MDEVGMLWLKEKRDNLGMGEGNEAWLGNVKLVGEREKRPGAANEIRVVGPSCRS